MLPRKGGPDSFSTLGAITEFQLRPGHIPLGSPGDSFLVRAGSRVVQDTRGFYYVGPALSPGRVLLYDSTGQQLRAIGTPGPGPEEIGRIERIALDPHDTLHVYHGLRHTVFSPSFESVRTSRLPGRIGGVTFLQDGRQLVTAFVATRERAGYTMHILDGDSLSLSFGLTSGKGDPVASAMVMAMQVVPSAPEQVWLAHGNQYRLERWDPSGSLLRVITRDVWWFPASTYPLRTSVQGGIVQEDTAGNLWTVARIPTLDAKRPIIEGPERKVDYTSYESFYGQWASMVEVIDPQGGRLIASQRFPFSISGFVTQGTVCRFNEDDLGYMVLEIHRIRVRRP